jgi:hypothetical protein
MRMSELDIHELCKKNNLVWLSGEAITTTSSIVCMDSDGYIAPIEIRRIGRERGLRIVSKHHIYSLDNIKKYLINNNRQITLLSKNYENAKSHLLVKCDVCSHEWGVTWDNLRKKGCPSCSNSIPHTPEKVLEICNSIRKDVVYTNPIKGYNYWYVDCECLNNSSHPKWTSPLTSIQRGCGCTMCGHDIYGGHGGLNPTNAERNKKEWLNKDCVIYSVKLFNDIESFYKIGITTTTVRRRMAKIKTAGYGFELIETHQTNLYDAIGIEMFIHDNNSNKSYTPQNKFEGWTECYTKPISLNIITNGGTQ